jgi:hypothetical protein
MEKLEIFFTENPRYFGFVIVAFGACMLWGAIKDWDWFFKSKNLSR